MTQIYKSEIIDINKLTEDGKNPNKMSSKGFAALKKVIQKYGFIVPVICNKDYVIADGAHRVQAAKDLGMTQIPVIKLDIKEVDRRLLRQIMNKLKGEHNVDLDQEEFKYLLDMNYEEDLLSLLPDHNNDIKKLLRNIEEQGIISEDETVDVISYERAKSKCKIQKGDVFKLGNHRLMCGDSTDKNQVIKLVGDNKMQGVWTDPPWNVAYGSHTNTKRFKHREIINDNLKEEFGEFLSKVFYNYTDICQDGAMVYVVMSSQEWGNIMKTMELTGFHWSSTIIWSKDALVLSRKDYHTQYEPIWYGWKEGTRLVPLLDRTQSDVWNIDRPKRSDEHPTMKPIELINRSLLNSTEQGVNIADLFGGSGSTLIACEQTGRKCFMMELDPVYCQVIIDRWEKYTDRKAEKVE